LPLPDSKCLGLLVFELDPWLVLELRVWLEPPPELPVRVPLPELELRVAPPLELWLPLELNVWPPPELKL
jgi:hypothetical protein